MNDPTETMKRMVQRATLAAWFTTGSSARLAGLTQEIHEEKRSLGHTEGEAQPWNQELRLACVAEQQRGHGPVEQTQETFLQMSGIPPREDSGGSP